MYHYYLTPATTSSIDTIFVVDASDEDSAQYLRERLGYERITRSVAIDVDRTHRHTGRGSAWAKPEVQYPTDTLAEIIAAAAEATEETIRFSRENDALQAEIAH